MIAEAALVVTNPDLVEEIKQLIREEDLTQSSVAKAADVSQAALSAFLNRKPLSNKVEVDRKLGEWLRTRRERQDLAARLPELQPFIKTHTAERILAAAAFAHAALDIAVVVGPPGVGKSQALEHYKKTRSSVWLATMRKSSATLVPALSVVANAVGLKGRLPAGALNLVQKIEEHIADKAGLLIIDEAQHLGMDALEELRSIHDASDVGLVLAGNEQVYQRLTGGERDATFAQLFSRIGKRVHLSRPRREDVIALAEHWNVGGDRDSLAFLVEKAPLPGGLRQLTKCLRLAAMFAGVEGRGIEVDDLRRAWIDLNLENGPRKD